MEKQALREWVWDTLEEVGEARFPFPPHGRIPNFAGAEEAADRLQSLNPWQSAECVKSNPDAPQLPVRRAVLRQGKSLYMAVPRLRDEACFLKLDPAEIADIDHATTVSGSSEVGVPVHPSDVPVTDLIISGSVAVTEDGARIGKGEGYSDLEFAILRECGVVDDSTTVVTTVHEFQVVDEDIPIESHDVPLDWIVTPERVIQTGAQGSPKPSGIDWAALDDETIAEIPILQAFEPDRW